MDLHMGMLRSQLEKALTERDEALRSRDHLEDQCAILRKQVQYGRTPCPAGHTGRHLSGELAEMKIRSRQTEDENYAAKNSS